MQKMIGQINSASLKYGMKVKAGETGVMKFSKDHSKVIQMVSRSADKQ